MPGSLHHVTVQTRQSARLGEFVTHVLGMRQVAAIVTPRNDVAPLMGWPNGSEDVTSVLFGGGSGAFLEVVQIPSDVPGEGEFSPCASGLLQLCMEIDDLEAVMSEARSFPVDAAQGPSSLSVSGTAVQVGLVWVAGARFQFTEMSSH